MVFCAAAFCLVTKLFLRRVDKVSFIFAFLVKENRMDLLPPDVVELNIRGECNVLVLLLGLVLTCVYSSLAENGLGAEGGVAIGKALEVNGVLTSLDIGCECSVLCYYWVWY